MKMIKLLSRNASVFVAAGLATVAGGVANADVLSDVIEGFTADGKASMDIRTRYEYNDTPTSEALNSFGIRTRLGYTSGEYNGFQAMVEMEDISFLDNDDHPGLDTPTTELNQFWLSYKNEVLSGKFGRQIYTLDDQRFIGHVGWRQNIQTFDAVSSVFDIGDVKVNFAYLDAVNRVDASSEDLAGVLLNAAYTFTPELNVTGFVYLLDFDERASWSGDTFGFRANGAFGDENLEFNYIFSYAIQSDNGGSPSGMNFTTDYLAGEISGKANGMTGAVGFEILGSDDGHGFTTPLATVHKFNGFADVFAGNSIAGSLSKGLKDIYLKFAFKAGVVPLTFVYHDFSTATGGFDLGSEIDAVASFKLNDYTTLLTKFAYYDSDSAGGVAYGQANKTVFTLEANVKF